MSREERKSAQARLEELLDRAADLDRARAALSEDLAYQIKLFVRSTGFAREEWCSERGVDAVTFEEALSTEEYEPLKQYAGLILNRKVIPQANQRPGSEAGSFNTLTRLRRALETQDPERIWASISFYILVEHKNIIGFCDALAAAGLDVKYSTFRTDKHHKKLATALKYAALIEEFHVRGAVEG